MTIALSHEELDAARNLVESGFPRQAISRAYYAAFYAARAALEATGEPSPKTHAGMRSRFSDLRAQRRASALKSAGRSASSAPLGGRGLRRSHHHDRGSDRRDREGAASRGRDRARHRGRTGNSAAAIVSALMMEACAAGVGPRTLSVCAGWTKPEDPPRSRQHRPTGA